MQRPPRSTNPADVRAALHLLVDELPSSLLESAHRSIEYLCRQGATMETFTFGGVPFEAEPNSGGDYRDLDTIQEASVREVPHSNPRKTVIQSSQGGRAELSTRIRVRAKDWERFQALRSERDGVHLLVFNGKTCNAQLSQLTEQPNAKTEPGKVLASATFIKLPRSFNPAEVIDWGSGRR